MYQRWMPTDLVRRLGEDQRNFEVAVERALGRGDLDAAICITATFQGVYEAHGLTDMWGEMLESLFNSAPAETIAAVMVARLNGLECLPLAVNLAVARGDAAGARARADRYLEVARTSHNDDLEAWALYSLAQVDIDDPQSTRDILLRAQRLYSESTDRRPLLRAWIGVGLAISDLERSDFASARRISEELVATGDLFTQMNALQALASAAFALGDELTARAAVARYLEGQGRLRSGLIRSGCLPRCRSPPMPSWPHCSSVPPPGSERNRARWIHRADYEQPFRVKTVDTVRRTLGDDVFDRFCQEGRDTPIHLLLERAGMPNQGTVG